MRFSAVLLLFAAGCASQNPARPRDRIEAAIFDAQSRKVAHDIDSVSRLLEGIEGIKVDEFSGVARISGELQNPDTVLRDYERIYQAEVLFVCLNTVTFADSLYEKAASEMQKEIDKLDGGSGMKVRVLNRTFLLEGSAPSEAVRERAELMVSTLLPPVPRSDAIRENALALGAKRFSIRNLLQVNGREPASTCPKN